LVGRRRFLVQAGRGALGIAVLGLAGCSGSGETGDGTGPASTPPTPSGSPPTGDDGSGESTTATNKLVWSRVDLGFVATYVLVRGGEAAVVDTGVDGSADAIGAVLEKAGQGWAGSGMWC
jgi:hypothetical protein